jgi:undecaprenyl-diphosphatase
VTALTLASAAAFVLLALLMGRISAWDDAGVRALATWRTPVLNNLMRSVSWLGSGSAEFPFAFAVTGTLAWRGRKRLAAEYFGWALGGWAVYALLKTLFHRARPHVVERLSGGGWYSFPSGHAMLGPIVFVFAAILLAREFRAARSLHWWVPIAWFLSLMIAFSRVYLGVHYPSDVVGGLLAGSAWVGLALVMMSRSELSRRPNSNQV